MKTHLRLRKEPTYLSDYDVTFSTAAEQSNNYLSDDDSDKKRILEIKRLLYVIMDSIICSMKIRFSEESLCLATSADRLMQFDYEGSSFLVEHYKVGYIYTNLLVFTIYNVKHFIIKNKMYFQDLLNINENNLKSEMLVFKNIIGDNIKDFNFIKENLNKSVSKFIFNGTCYILIISKSATLGIGVDNALTHFYIICLSS